MALEIYLSADGETPTHPAPEDGLKLFQDEGYTFLYPHLQAFRRATGVPIDLYEDSYVNAEALHTLRMLLLRLLDEVNRSEADTWVVSIPHRHAAAVDEPLPLHRRELSALLVRFLALADRALVLNAGLVCLGD